MTPAVSVSDLRKTYKTGTVALRGVSLEVAQGDFFALLGPNGAGKTTIIGILCGLTVKTGGEAKIFDASIDTDPVKAKSYIGLVPQEFNINIFEKVIDIIVDQAGFYGIPRAEAIKKAEPILKDLGLWEKRNEPSQQLSGGMKRRLMIARALIHKPQLLILDEPTAGVDVELRRSMWGFLRKMNAEGTTIILTTHYLEEAEQLCRTVAVINKGEIVLSEPMTTLLQRYGGEEKLEDIYLGLIGAEKEEVKTA
ncbi:ABC transporter [Candidatus Adlerbacteria bacterium RIFCSPHIGHO2_12_FULL_53_18]|uniref:ABC transporter n=1 Tax=Candidatus Adlerbacteria bacterium RIFCSPHIGHO2_12_FULL_53_18 TaxID=1797242 RepID=A0A1F4XUA4_9BACT|nr:MAG: ABC transporter [Candidatus Adlerbacteria bacterium RIFCSPHIGHO2_12_FULL_53_18]